MLQKEHKIVITGPTTLGAILNSLQWLLHTRHPKRTGEVWTVLGAVKPGDSKFGGLLEKCRRTSKAQETNWKVMRLARAIEKLRQVEQLPHEESQKFYRLTTEDE